MKNKHSGRTEEVSARQKALDLLLYRTRTEKELYTKLEERGYSPEECEDALAYVRHYGYVNDREYALRYVSSRGSQKGRAAIRSELRAKGVPDEDLEYALETLPEEDHSLPELIRKKAGIPHRLDEKEYRRLYGFLARRGFSASGISRALKNYQADEEADS